MKIEHFALQVPAPAEMAQWYCRHLGFTVARAGGEPSFAHFLQDSSGTVLLEIYHNPNVPTPAYARQQPLVMHLAFVSEALEPDRDRLLAAGATLAEDLTVTPAGDKVLMLRDPWGIPVQLVRRRTPMV